MLSVVLVLALATTALASGLNYQGQYQGKCGNDGFYYNDGRSFTICSNGNAYHQPCAPGSLNSPAGNYKVGYGYSTTSFCDVNLVDNGYAVRHGGYGGKHRASYGNHGASYGGNPGGYGTSSGYGTGYGTNFGYGAGYGTGYGIGYGTGYGGPGYQSGYSSGYPGGYGSRHQGGYGSGYGAGYGVSYGGHRGGYGQPANPKGIGAGKGFVGGYPAGH